MSETVPITQDSLPASEEIRKAKAYHTRELPADGQVVGLSLSGCVYSVLDGFPVTRIQEIITGAQVDFSKPESAKKWAEQNQLSDGAEHVLMQLFQEGKIRVVDRNTASPSC